MPHYFNVGEGGEGGRKKGAGLFAIDDERIKIKRWSPREYMYIRERMYKTLKSTFSFSSSFT